MTPSIEQAIEWHARQSSGAFGEDERKRFRLWLEASPANAEAWHSLQQRLDRTLAPLASSPARQALQAPRSSRRALLRGALALGGLAIGARLLSQPGMPLANWNADVRTSTAERRRIELPDGSWLTLNAESAADLDFTTERRRILLRGGGVLAEVSPAQAPFVLACAFGEARLPSGRCLLELQEDFAQFWLLDGRAHVSAYESEWQLLAGQGVRLDAGGMRRLQVATGNPDAWTRGLLEARDQALGDVIERLRPYHHGVLQVAPAAAELRISGVFTLDDSRRALAALAEVLPLRIDSYLGVWTRIDRA